MDMTWYKHWFGEDYLKVYPHRDETEAQRQIDFVEKVLPLKKGDRVLDLGCGNGRHASQLSRRGYAVTCLDLSTELLNLARRRYGKKCCLGFVQADMRYIPFNAAFDAVLSFFTTFGYFQTDEENVQTLVSLRTALRPGGWFLEDYVNKTYVIENLVPLDSRKSNGIEVIQERRYNRKLERVEKKITLKENGQVREYFESVRLYTFEEMQAMLARAGLMLEQTFGEFDGRPFDQNSPRLILIGRRPR